MEETVKTKDAQIIYKADYGGTATFRIGKSADKAITFRADKLQFHDQLANAVIDHALEYGPEDILEIQVKVGPSWYNAQDMAGKGVQVRVADLADNAKVLDLWHSMAGVIKTAESYGNLASSIAKSV